MSAQQPSSQSSSHPFSRLRRALCRVGLHLPLVVEWARTPDESRRECMECGAMWRGTYDGIDLGWERVR